MFVVGTNVLEPSVNPYRKRERAVEVVNSEDYLWLKKHFSAIFLGVSRSGKTTFLVDYLMDKDCHKFNSIVVFTNSPAQPLWSKLEGSGLCVSIYSVSDFEDLDVSIKVEGNGRLVIFDDCADKLKNNSKVHELYTRGRHNNYSIIVLEQHFVATAPLIRRNTQYFLIFPRGMRDESLVGIQNFVCPNLDIKKVVGKWIERDGLKFEPLIVNMENDVYKYRRGLNYSIKMEFDRPIFSKIF